MEQIEGKILVFADLHLGLKSGSKSRLAICINAVKEIISYIKENDVQTCIFLGDWHHVRVSTENNVMNVSYKLMAALAKHCKVYCILGNHDIYMKNSVDINSLVMFNNILNVNIIDKVTLVSVNGNTSLLVPWLGDLSAYKKETIDMMFGHFDVAHEYLIKSYIEEHSVKNAVVESISSKLDNDKMLYSDRKSKNAGDYIGDFIDVVKKGHEIFSGHIHARKEFIAKGRKFIFTGDPYQLNLGEKDNICGFYVIDKTNSYSFHEIKSVPKHIELRISEVIKDLDNYDFSLVKGNILHKVYDVEIDNLTDAKISQKINDWLPYEELLPDYDLDLSTSSEIKILNESIALIKKSKLDYVKTYINNIDKKVLEDKNIDPYKLYNILSEYYNAVTEEK